MTEVTTLRDRDRDREGGDGWRLGPKLTFLLELVEFAVGAVLGLAFIGLFFRGHFLVTLLVICVAVYVGRRLKTVQDRERFRPRLRAGALVMPPRTRNLAPVIVFSVMALVFLVGGPFVVVDQLRHQHIGLGPVLEVVLGGLLGGGIGVMAVVGAWASLRQLVINRRGLQLRSDTLVVNSGRLPVTIPWTDLTSRETLRSLSSSPEELAVLIYYLDHPESRAELGTEAALDRVASLSRTEG